MNDVSQSVMKRKPAGAVTVRRAAPGDAAAIAALHVRSWRAAYADIVDTAYLSALDAGAQERRMLAPGSGCLAADDPRVAVFVAECAGKICGWASAGPSREDGLDGAELYSIYLDPDMFGVGAGDALLAACFHHARALGHAAMNVRALAGNVRACRFYRRHGARRLRRSGADEVEIGGRSYPLARFRWEMAAAGA